MKSYELMPTHENLINAFSYNAIDRNKDVFSFADILNSLEDSCSIALDGNWGSGKTFFVHQVKMFLEATNPFITTMSNEDREIIIQEWKHLHKNNEPEIQPHVAIYYDAWENDSDDDPVLSIVYTILKSIDASFEISQEADFFSIASDILETFTNHNWGSLINSFRSEDPLAELRKSKAIQEEIERFFDAILEERGNRLVIFVDELDRCKPSFAVRLLERIKHYFSNERISFVFSINTSELQHTIKRYYGNDFDAYRYLDRFFDLRMSLPPADLNLFYRSLNFNSSMYVYDVMCHSVITKYNFSLREIAKYLRLTKIAAHKPTHSEGKDISLEFPEGRAKLFCMYFIVPIMLGLKVSDTNRLNRFVAGEDYSPLMDFSTVNLHIFEDLLNRDEDYNPANENIKKVDIDDKLKEVYEAVFNIEYSGALYHKSIGKYLFNKDTKGMLLRVTGLFSGYNSFDYE